MYEIEHGIPIPRKTKEHSISRYPFAQLAVGDSFFMQDVGATIYKPSRLGFLYTLAKKRYGFKIATRRVENGVRVWRIA